MRGAPIDNRIPLSYERIIPADAGSTNREIARISISRDHPRGCGEHQTMECY